MPFIYESYGGGSSRSSFITSVEEILPNHFGDIHGAQDDVETASTATPLHYLQDYGVEFDDFGATAAEAYDLLRGIGNWINVAGHGLASASPSSLPSEDEEMNIFSRTTNTTYNSEHADDDEALAVFRTYHAFIHLSSPPISHPPFVCLGDGLPLATTVYTPHAYGLNDENLLAHGLDSEPESLMYHTEDMYDVERMYDIEETQRWIPSMDGGNSNEHYQYLCEFLAEFDELFETLGH
jgi:hypothetical protein